MGSGQMTKILMSFDLIEIIQFSLKIYWWVCGWLGGSVGQWVGSDQMTKNLISLDLIEIIQFCLKIYDL